MKAWIEAMRLRTLPVSASGVVTGGALAAATGDYCLVPWFICLVFALMLQIASNFANEYYDYVGGIDEAGRVGPRRGVTEGDITPHAMKRATYLLVALACAVGLSLVWWGGWWLLAAGAFIALGALSYSAGPYPLSRHALGEVAVVVFFGIVPVTLTFYVMTGRLDVAVAVVGTGVGLLSSLILMVNNYRDVEDDRRAHKTTIATLLGLRAVWVMYIVAAVGGLALMWEIWRRCPWAVSVPVVLYVCLWVLLSRWKDRQLNKLLGMTAMTLLFTSLLASFILLF